MATNTMDWDMETDAPPIESPTQFDGSADQLDVNQAADSNTLDVTSTLAPTKVHIRGLDTLTTKEIKEYVREHYGEADRVEWIDDTSANILFSHDSIAIDAMNALSVNSVDFTANPDPDVLFEAKPVSGKPEISLKIRPAFISDKKEAGAAQRSRFYLLNPEYDPEERARRRETRDRDRYNNRRYDNRRSQRNNHRRDDDDEIEKFSDSFYDDGEVDPPRSRHRERSYSRSRSRSRTRDRNQGKELFPDRSTTQRSSGRDRSASPMRDLDENMDVDSREGRPGRNQDRERFIKHQQRLNNRTKELFPLKKLGDPKSSSAQLDRLDRERLGGEGEGTGSYMGYAIKGSASKPPVKELFLSKVTNNSNSTKELFADKLERRGKPRERAEDHW